MVEGLQEPVEFFLLVMAIILVTPLLSERLHLPGIIGIIVGGILVGPHGFHLLEAGDRIQFLSTIGLVYLMFSAGLEVDIHQFIRVRSRALIFGLLTFAFPQLLGMGLGRLLGLNWLGSILLGSAFASHTLIAFPILTRLGVTRNEAVAVTAGATVLTDLGAFVILAVVLGAKAGRLEIGYFVQLFVLLVIFVGLVLFVLPRLGKMFFQRFHGPAIEFQFVLVVLFVAALTAERIGIHEVVGAFLAGLAINVTLPRHSPVNGHVLFVGESFFIPVFLLYSGMITDPLSFLKTPQTVLVATGVTVVAYASKWIAAWLTARLFKYSRAEFLTTFGLSHAQAAVTIPTLVIGLETGLFGTTLFNAAILMILLTSISSPLIVQRFAPRLLQARETELPVSMFSRILVPISDPQTQHFLLELASLLAKTKAGKVMAVNVIRSEHGRPQGMREQKVLLARVPEIVNDPDYDIELIPRLSTSYAQGILHTSVERNASLILIGWRGKRNFQQNALGRVLDEVVWESDIPVMVGKLGHSMNGMQRVLLLLPANTLAPIAMRRMLQANFTIAEALNVPLYILADASYLEQIHELSTELQGDTPCSVERMIGALKPNDLEKDAQSDLLVVPGFGSRQRFLASLGNLPERLAASFSGNLIILHFDR